MHREHGKQCTHVSLRLWTVITVTDRPISECRQHPAIRASRALQSAIAVPPTIHCSVSMQSVHYCSRDTHTCLPLIWPPENLEDQYPWNYNLILTIYCCFVCVCLCSSNVNMHEFRHLTQNVILSKCRCINNLTTLTLSDEKKTSNEIK